MLTLRRAHSDSGVALVVALIITLISFVLATAVLADAFHVVFGSLQVQRRVNAIDVAEAGVNWFANDIEADGHGPKYLGGLVAGSPWSGSGSGPYTRSAVTVQGGTFSLSVLYKRTDGTPLSMNPVASPFPTTLRAVVTSTGTSSGTARTLHAELLMQPNYGGINGAFSGMFICELGNRFTITGPNVNLYLLGSASLSGCGNDLIVNSGQFSVSGNVWVLTGSATLTAKTFIGGDLWVKGAATIGSPPGQAAPGGQCKASATPQKVIICGNVTAGGDVPTVSKLHGTVLGNISQCVAPCPQPTIQFPIITAATTFFTSTGWTNGGSVLPASSGGVTSMPSSAVKTYYTVNAGCSAPYELPLKILLRADTALLSDCGFTAKGNFEAKSANTGRYTLYLITYHVADDFCGTRHYTEFKNNVDATGVNFFIYNPCEAKFRNQVNMAGQIVARQLRAQGQTTIAYSPTVIQQAALASVSSFRADVVELYEL